MAMSDTTSPDGDRDRDDNPESETGSNVPASDEAVGTGASGFDSELELGDDDTSLPWLEGSEDDDDFAGYSPAQLIAYVLIGLLALGLIVGGIWWATHRDAEGELVADGSVIQAPEGDYKQRPDEPGGKTFEGTGDSSFAVSEGESRPAQLGKPGAKADAAAKPGFDTVGAGAEGGKPAAKDSAAGTVASVGESGSSSAESTKAYSGSSGVGVQVAAYSTRAMAESGWSRLSGQYSSLKGMRYRIVEGKADIGTVYRLQALPGNVAAANALCSKLQAAGQACHVKK